VRGLLFYNIFIILQNIPANYKGRVKDTGGAEGAASNISENTSR